MTDHQSWRRRSVALVACVLAAACSETYRSSVVENATPAVEAVLVLSSSSPAVGDVIVVSVQASSNQGTVGSYTARILYDPTALRYDGEVPVSDKALRAVNPQSGLVRLAGAASGGFVDGRLASYRFIALTPNAAKSLSLTVDEIHLISRVDAKTALTVVPNRPVAK